jgi:hypothetical protein
MKKKKYLTAIILNAFIGYLWVLFAKQMYSVADSMHNAFFGWIIIFIGTGLFWTIERRILPFQEYKRTHPVKIVGGVSFLTVIFVGICIFKFIY